jgi:hypothetical protein
MARTTILIDANLRDQYREAARDAAREAGAKAWVEGLARGVDETRPAMSRAELLGIERALRVQLALR